MDNLRFGLSETDRPTPRKIHWIVNTLLLLLLPTIAYVEQIAEALKAAGAPAAVTDHVIAIYATITVWAKVIALFIGGTTNYKPEDK